MSTHNNKNSSIEPLSSIEEYLELSKDELSARAGVVYSELATMASTYNTRRRTSVDYLLREVDEYKTAGTYDTNSVGYKKSKEIELARKVVELDDLCGTVLDRLVALCITKGSIENVKNRKVLTVLKQWEDHVGNLSDEKYSNSEVFTVQPHGLGVMLEYVLERLFVDGDAFISEVWGESVELPSGTYKLPYKIRVHDTLVIGYDENEFEKTGREKAYIDLNSVSGSSFTSPSEKNRKINLYGDKENFTTHLKLRPKTFYFWGTSYFKRAFSPIANKKRIEALEINTIEGMINRLTIIKAGKLDADTESGIIAPHRLALLETMLSQPKTNSLILWPGDDLTVEDIGPESSILSYEKKYEAANEKTLASLGMPRVLIDGLESSTENWQKFLGITSFIEKVRNIYIVPWVNAILRKIAVANGYEKEYPRFSFARVKLYDLRRMMDVVKLFYDRGLMSELSALTNGDLDFDVERSRREYEQNYGIISSVGGPGFLPFSKNTEEGSDKEGNSSPEKDVDKEDSAEASIQDLSRKQLIETFGGYLYALHDFYTRRIVKIVSDKNYDSIPAIMLAYSMHAKRIYKEQMRILFSQQVFGKKLDNDLLDSAYIWIDSYFDGFISDLDAEINKVIDNNKNKEALLAGLVGGIMSSFKTARLSKYSSSIYNKAVSAGNLTAFRADGLDNVTWKCTFGETSCEFCKAMHNITLPAQEFFMEFPPHPNCNCFYEGTKSDVSDVIPIKDKSNWSAPTF